MKRTILFLLSLLYVATVCAQSQNNALTSKEEKQGWKLLFNGKNLNGWTMVGKDTPPPAGWVVEDGSLIVRKAGDKRGGDIITTDKYTDFELLVDFKITKGANSGIKYLFTEYEKGGWLGLEYQVLDDDNHPDAKLGREGNRKTAGLYDMFPAGKKQQNPVGRWNQARIVVKGSKVDHYLNGKKTISFDRASDLYKKTWEMSKFKECIPMFGAINTGYILLQDHGDEVAYRNIKIKAL